MTPTESEKQAALAWADRREEDVAIVVHPESFWRHVFVLASALRQAEAERDREQSDRLTVQFDMGTYKTRALNAESNLRVASSRLKTLEKENARMLSIVVAAEKYKAGMPYNACGCYIQERFDLFAALKQEAE